MTIHSLELIDQQVSRGCATVCWGPVHKFKRGPLQPVLIILILFSSNKNECLDGVTLDLPVLVLVHHPGLGKAEDGGKNNEAKTKAS